MKKLMLKFACFVGLALIVLLPVCMYWRHILDSALKDNVFKFGNNVDTIIIGDSHPETSIDPAFLSGSVNLSLSEETFFYSYYKLKHVLSHNPQTKKVILGLSFYNYRKQSSEKFLFNETDNMRHFDKYYILLDWNAKKPLMRSNNFWYCFIKYDLGIPMLPHKEKLLKKSLNHAEITKNDIKFFGDFYKSTKSNLKNKNTYNHNKVPYEAESPIMLAYLDKIIELCEERGIRLYLFNAPMHRTVVANLDDALRREHSAMVTRLLTRHSQVKVIDFSNMILADKFFGDLTHTNAYGAEIVTKGVSEIVNGKVPDARAFYFTNGKLVASNVTSGNCL